MITDKHKLENNPLYRKLLEELNDNLSFYDKASPTEKTQALLHALDTDIETLKDLMSAVKNLQKG